MKKISFNYTQKIRQITDKNFKWVFSDRLAKEMIEEAEHKITELTLEKDGYDTNQDEIMKIAERSIAMLEDISGIWLRIELDIKQRFPKFLFLDGLTYDGSKFGINKLAYCIEPNTKSTLQKFPLFMKGYRSLTEILAI